MNAKALTDTPQSLAQSLGMPILKTVALDRLSKATAQKIPYTFVKKHCILPIEETDDVLTIALADPLNIDAIEELRFLLDKEVKGVFSSEEQIQKGINALYHPEEGATSAFIADLADEATTNGKKELESEAYDLLDIKEEAPII